jgi:hypothetical protein
MIDPEDDPLSVEAAGRAVGISPRTLRDWIVHGKLPATGGQRGKLVRLSDVMALVDAETARPAPLHAELAGSGFGALEPVGADHCPPSSSPIDGLFDELRDGVIWPLAERVEVLARENGRLAAERDAAVRARDELAARFGSDNRFVDDLVALLEAELDVARQRIAALETQLAQVTQERLTEASADASPVVGARGLDRRESGQAPAIRASSLASEPPEPETARSVAREAGPPRKEQPTGSPWWRRRRRRP